MTNLVSARSRLTDLTARMLLHLLALSFCCAYSLDAQQVSPDNYKAISPTRLAHLLREPNGLSKCADLVQQCVISDTPFVLSRASLSSLCQKSSIILVGRVSARESKLSDDGDDIYTFYTIKPNFLLKGTDPKPISFMTIGGYVAFPNGTSAEVRTVEWNYLQTGKQFLVFLEKANDGSYLVTGGKEGLFALPGDANGIPENLASHDISPNHEIVQEVKGLNLPALLSKVSAMVKANQLQ